MHSKRCLAASIIAAVENLRDMEFQTDHDFRIEVQKNTPLEWADSYLNDGTMTCTCGEYDVLRLFDMVQTHGIDSAQYEASEMLKEGTLSPDNYMRLARRVRLNDREGGRPLYRDPVYREMMRLAVEDEHSHGGTPSLDDGCSS